MSIKLSQLEMWKNCNINLNSINFDHLWIFLPTEFWEGQGQGKLFPQSFTRTREEKWREPKVPKGVWHGAKGFMVYTMQMEKSLQSLWRVSYLWQPLNQWFTLKATYLHSSSFKDKETIINMVFPRVDCA